jgi:chaperone BCS1
MRLGRCDVWIEFTNATKTQAHDLFLHFYPPESLQVSTITPEISHPANIGSPNDLESSPAATASLREKTISAEHLAAEFADKLPEGVVSVSALQAYLMRFKRRPEAAVLGVDAWVAGGFKQGPSCIFGSKVE